MDRTRTRTESPSTMLNDGRDGEPARPSCEALESRRLMSGTVLATVVGGSLRIRGDGEANAIVLDRAGLTEHQVRVTGSGDTAVNGRAEPAILSGVTRRVLVQMGDGADGVTISDLDLAGSLSVNAETVALESVDVAQNASIVNARGASLITVDDSTFGGALNVRTGTAADVVRIDAGGSAVGARTLFNKNVLVSLGGGADSLQVGVTGESGNAATMSGRANLNGGAGTDVMRSSDPTAFVGNRLLRVRGFESNLSAPEITAPTVSTASPAVGSTGVVVNRKVLATFSEPMDPLTITAASVTVTAAGAASVPGTVGYVGNTMSFTPASALAADTAYTVTVTTAAKDLAGNPLAREFAWTFTTGSALDAAAPAVSSTDPADHSTGVTVNKKFAANFSEPMDPLTLTSSSFLVTGANAAPVAGAVTYAGTAATFTPATALTPNTTYTATVTTAATDSAGNPLAADYTWTFTTGATADATAPTVVDRNPAGGATGVVLNKKVLITFSEAMDPLTITTASVSVRKPGSAALAGTVGYAGSTMTFTPAANLAPNTTYTTTVTTAAKDLAGNALTGSSVSTFTTGSTADVISPVVDSTNPDDGQANVAINKAVAAAFSEAMDPLTITAANMTLTGPGGTPVTGTVRYDSLNHIATMVPSANLAPDTLFTATLDGGTSNAVKDLAGNPLAADLAWTFTTGSQEAQLPVDLGAAGPFAVMATASVSGTGATQINGDVGLNPGSAQGIPPAQVNGTIHVNDQAVIDAQSDLLSAYNDATGRSVTPVALPGNIGGLRFTPGLYTNSTSVLLQGSGPGNNVTLDAQGDPNAIFIFQMGSTLTTGPGAQVILAGGAKAGNVFWQVGTSATLNTTTIFKGNILAAVTITVNAGSAVEGRLLSGSNSDGSVTVNASTVTVPAA